MLVEHYSLVGNGSVDHLINASTIGLATGRKGFGQCRTVRPYEAQKQI